MNSHLSRPHVAVRLKPPVEAHRANGSLQSALLRIGFAGPHGLPCAGELLPRLSTLTVKKSRRYLSVALSLRSPSAAVSRYPALWSPDFPQNSPFRGILSRGCPACSHFLFYPNRVRLSNKITASITLARNAQTLH